VEGRAGELKERGLPPKRRFLDLPLLVIEYCVDVAGIRPDRSKGGRYKLARSSVNGDVTSHSSVSSSHVTQTSTSQLLSSFYCYCCVSTAMLAPS